ncbi:MAG: PQQ-binding-like beta-propeller repeat protein [Sedimentisphaerales bacterium]
MKNFCLVWLLVFTIFLPSVCDAVISEKLLNEAGLQTVWQSAIPLNPPSRTNPKEKVEKITVLGNYLYILTNSNYLFCLDRHTGRLSFAAAAAEPKMPVFEPADYNGIAYLIAANNVIAVDVEKGAELYRHKIPFSVSAAAAVNADYLYIPGTDKRLHITDVNGRFQRFKVGSSNDASAVTGVIATDKFAIFTTKAGNVICMNPSEPKRLWQFDAVDAVTALPVIVQNWLYVGSKDTNLYKLDTGSGEMIWKFYAGSVLDTSARATETIVYQYAINKGLYAIDANSGKQIWLLPDGIDLLAQNGNTVYVFEKTNICTVMDNKQAKKIYTINFAPVTTFAANVYDDKIYIMEDKNISCIGPKVK